MEAGKLRHRVTLQQRTEGRNPVSGAMLPAAWVDVATVWAAVLPLSARDFIAAKAEQSEITKRIVIRYRQGVLPTMRIVYRGEIYNIVGPPLEDAVSGRDYLSILVSAGVNDG